MDIGTIVNWIQVAIWVVAVGAFIVKVQRGEANMPAFLKNNLFIGVVIALGICGSIASVYLHYAHPKIVEKIVEKPVDRIVEKIVPAECPPTQTVRPVGKLRPKTSTPTQPTPGQTQFCEGGNCAQSSGQTGGVT